MSAASSGQLGFDALLRSADADNHARTFARETAHLPATMDGALPFFRDQLRDHHAPMLAGNVDETMRLRGQADKLASRLNGGDPGILAGPDAPGCVLERESAAAPGAVPLWGQTESFIVELRGMRVRVEMEGVFGTGSGVCFWPGFAARAVDLGRPFLSPTGYRSFLGIHADLQPGLTPRRVRIARDRGSCRAGTERQACADRSPLPHGCRAERPAGVRSARRCVSATPARTAAALCRQALRSQLVISNLQARLLKTGP